MGEEVMAGAIRSHEEMNRVAAAERDRKLAELLARAETAHAATGVLVKELRAACMTAAVIDVPDGWQPPLPGRPFPKG
jgi:hypothetical protein